jgi:hypothetical protein
VPPLPSKRRAVERPVTLDQSVDRFCIPEKHSVPSSEMQGRKRLCGSGQHIASGVDARHQHDDTELQHQTSFIRPYRERSEGHAAFQNYTSLLWIIDGRESLLKVLCDQDGGLLRQPQRLDHGFHIGLDVREDGQGAATRRIVDEFL